MPNHLRLARKLALLSHFRFRLGCCIVKSGRVMATGYNTVGGINSLSKQYFEFSTIHAEICALSKLDPLDIKGSVLYVYRLKKDGSPGLSRPCPNCLEAIRYLGVKRIVFSASEYPYFGIERI